MSAYFTTVYPNAVWSEDGETMLSYDEPWEAECDFCGERIDLDHYYDIEAHDIAERERLGL